jgi:hypothetical protein
VALILGIKAEANISRVGGGRGSDEVFGFSGNRMARGNKTGEGGEFAKKGAESIADGVAGVRLFGLACCRLL